MPRPSAILMPRVPVPSPDARLIAWDALRTWEDGRHDFLDDALAAQPGFAALDDRDQGLARELTLGVVRNGRLYDHLAATFLSRPDPSPPLTRTLRLACHQLFALDRVPPHAVGATAIDILRARGCEGLTGVANAVIRRLSAMRQDSRSCDGPLGRLPAAAVPGDVAVAESLPASLVADLAPLLDEDPARRLADLNRMAPLCTRTRVGLPPPPGRSVLRRDGPWTWWDDPREALSGPVADHRCVVQDRAQGAVVDLVVALGGARPGDLVADVCAAPGGKASSLAERGCQVFPGDIGLDKARTLRAALPRVLVHDGRHPALARGAFDLVLVDAPCSNSGVLGRRPEARWRYSAASRASLAHLQAALLAAAAPLVRADGRLVYSTCSLVPAENQGIAHRLAGWRVLGERLCWPDTWQGGGYACVLVRSS